MVIKAKTAIPEIVYAKLKLLYFVIKLTRCKTL